MIPGLHMDTCSPDSRPGAGLAFSLHEHVHGHTTEPHTTAHAYTQSSAFTAPSICPHPSAHLLDSILNWRQEQRDKGHCYISRKSPGSVNLAKYSGTSDSWWENGNLNMAPFGLKPFSGFPTELGLKVKIHKWAHQPLFTTTRPLPRKLLDYSSCSQNHITKSLQVSAQTPTHSSAQSLFLCNTPSLNHGTFFHVFITTYNDTLICMIIWLIVLAGKDNRAAFCYCSQ